MIDSLLRMIGLGKINTVKDDGNAQLAQVQLTAAETRDHSPVLGLFGVISNAPVGSDAVYLAQGGDRSKVVVIATNHQASRFRAAPGGASGLYDQIGSHFLLTNDTNGKLVLSGSFTTQIGDTTVVVSASGVALNGGSVTVTGGDVIADGISLKNHEHTSGTPGSPTSAPIAGT